MVGVEQQEPEESSITGGIPDIFFINLFYMDMCDNCHPRERRKIDVR